ncbi:MAG: peptide ABC transporter substrate-binding protein [Dehalococcoidia bacterium]
MADWTVSELAEQFKAGKISRRHFIGRMLSVGLTMPVIASVLAACGSSSNNANGNKAASTTAGGAATGPAGAAATGTTAAAAGATFNPTKRGGGGTLKLLWWQSPTLPQPHLSNGTKDFDASRIFYEPLAEFDGDGNLVPILAAEVPTAENGGVAKDGASVTWKLKPGVTWHDGQPFTADDVVFTFQYTSDPTTATTTIGNYVTVQSVDKVDTNTVKVTFKNPVPYWQIAFVGSNGMIIPQHIFGQYKGTNSKNSPNNLKPVGTGPYKYVDFKPGDSLQADLYENYHVANRPFFDHVFLKGGGDAPSAARAVLQTGDYDYGWNIQVAWDELTNLAKSGPGRIVISPGASCEHMNFNFTDPNKEVNGEVSNLQTKHPYFSDVKVRQAFAMMFDRKTLQQQLYGDGGAVTDYLDYNPKKYLPGSATPREFNAQKASQMLDDAGWKKGSDGVRAKDGVKMKVLYATSVNDLRQQEQQIIKKTLEQNGIQVELKSTSSDVFFGAPDNPDNLAPFHADMQMYTNGTGIDPQAYFRAFVSTTGKAPNDNIAQKANGWAPPNSTRYVNLDCDKIWLQASAELDPIKRADLFKKMNQMIFDEAPRVPLVARNGVQVAKKDLQGVDVNPFSSSDLWRLANWHRG